MLRGEKIYLYGHSSSANHGNEAIVRGIKKVFEEYDIIVFSFLPEKDKEFDLDEDVQIIPMGISVNRYHPVNIINHYYRKRKGLLTAKYIEFMFKNLLDQERGVFLFEMGDQYCETKLIRNYYSYVNAKIIEKGSKTVAYGCSIYPEILKDKDVINDLNNYSLILPRESRTYKALRESGVNTKIIQIVDPAFAMESQKCYLPEIFYEKDIIGINSGPVATTSEALPSYHRYLENLRSLIVYLFKTTDFAIALIPHVNWNASFSDISTLSDLYEEFKDSNRIVLIPEQNAKKQKYVISKCRFKLALRTHASIGAYSSYVPTLVTAYSKKAQGIAEDLLGTADDFIIPIASMKSKDRLVEGFRWLIDNEEKVKNLLNRRIPSYIQGAFSAKDEVSFLFSKN